MRKEKNSNYYNNNIGRLSVPIEDSSWLPIYNFTLKFILDFDIKSKIIDLGCGSGRFAKLLYQNGYYDYIGIDFSKKLINIAKKYVPQFNFICGNILNDEIQSLFDAYDIFVILEVLEHIEKDILIIKNIPIGKDIIFSVPNFLSKSHVRAFDSPNDVLRRYDKYLRFKELSIHTSKKPITHLRTGKKTSEKMFTEIFVFRCIRIKEKKLITF